MKRTGFTPYVVTGAALMALGLSLIALDAHAISRYTSTSMSCASLKSAVRNEGAVILRWTSSQGNPRHGRFVANSGYCDPGQRAVIASVPSANQKSCSVSECKRCDFRHHDDFFRLGPC